MLALPSGATVTDAYLSWAARRSTAGADLDVTLTRPGVFNQPITANPADTYGKTLADGNLVCNLALFDGFDLVQSGQNQKVSLASFQVPNAGCTGKLGVVASGGDNQINGDRLYFNPTNFR